MSLAAAPKNEPYFPLAGLADDGWSNDTEATATCYCGKVQMKFPHEAPGLVDTFACSCSDCKSFSATSFATNFVALDSHTSFVRGEELLTEFSQSKTIGSGGWMKQHFCKVCGTLMFRTGEVAPGVRIMRVGTVDDHMLAQTKLAPRIEQYTKDKFSWIGPLDTEIKCEASMDFGAVLGKTDRWAPKAKA
ncbi:uncharacterized protein RHOBADRAFT_39760 [Rhodotorula graminis WP1]|uniref:CENP-V/GFA domain-containing protein n=1 Tax=Rhodotorula graminis (strain WP1) TaxID=578459 RepID=A0A0P9IRJ3_RHOGW|nr:uncharacterized protein RHOBADRAFT_39760 [Rhodotorula graminis WP1]KPV72022.1 hypothetical protein RHOBADRAFT_39760 [Rhodotorula graminis WP1]